MDKTNLVNKQAVNPFLPSYEYVPDNEPHVFGNRLYIYGSHDGFGAQDFCINDYVCYSAPLDNLAEWKYEGVIYRANQDPKNKERKEHMNAPDACQGADGRYYLYYQLHKESITSVAVANKPEGPYEFYGYVQHPDGKIYGNVKGDAFNFDPGVLVDDDGRIYMYTGFAPQKGLMQWAISKMGHCTSGTVVELEKDMITLKSEEFATVPGPIVSKGTGFEGHEFYEASSPRKINGKYYLVYSSILSHELCYAVSDSPMGKWKYGGVLVSIADIGLPGVNQNNPKGFTGNTHGGMVEVNNQWYIFYHRQTNQQKCCRQGCAEKIFVREDGSILQAEMTSCGLNPKPLIGCGKYEARIACNLWGSKGTYAYLKTKHKEKGYPYFTQSGVDREKDPDQYIANMKNGSVAGFKYFIFEEPISRKLSVSVRGTGEGTMYVYSGEPGVKDKVAEIPVKSSGDWKNYSEKMQTELHGVLPLFFQYIGSGAIDFNSFEIMEEE